MARDPVIPQDIGRSTELRDLSFEPSAILGAAVTTIHPQLRDLIACPQERGRIYYVKGRGVMEMVVDHTELIEGAPKRRIRSFSELPFTPNCLTASPTLLACGGQSGELHLATLPPYRDTRASTTFSTHPWSLTLTLPHSSINNSFLLLPPHTADPLPTRPATPVPRRYPYATSLDSDSGSGFATFPNTLPPGGLPSLEAFVSADRRSADHLADPRMPDSRLYSFEEYRAAVYREEYGPYHAAPQPVASSSRSLPPSYPMPMSARENQFVEGQFDPLDPEDEPRLLVSNNDMRVSLFSIRSVGNRPKKEAARWGELPKCSFGGAGGRKLAKVGGVRLDTAVNHSSISPDGKTMVVVGDTSEVFLYEVIGGGREFKKIGTYHGALDAGFSTSFSSDGRKFAVASQDGQVTVWDHRSSLPLSKLYTSTSERRSYHPSITSTLASSLYSRWETDVDALWSAVPTLSDTGSGRPLRDAARVVKFSPQGAERDLLVFTEERNNIHIVDARTFDSHVSIPVPYETKEVSQRVETAVNPTTGLPLNPFRFREGVEGGLVGIAGACFDPTGDFLYTGTEKTIVEYDLRTVRKRGTGSSRVA